MLRAGEPRNSNLSLPPRSSVCLRQALPPGLGVCTAPGEPLSAGGDTPSSPRVKAAHPVEAASQESLTITGLGGMPARLRGQSPTSSVHTPCVHPCSAHTLPIHATHTHLWLQGRKVPAEGTAVPPSRAWAAGLWSQEPRPCSSSPRLPPAHCRGWGPRGRGRERGDLAQPQPPEKAHLTPVQLRGSGKEATAGSSVTSCCPTQALVSHLDQGQAPLTGARAAAAVLGTTAQRASVPGSGDAQGPFVPPRAAVPELVGGTELTRCEEVPG